MEYVCQDKDGGKCLSSEIWFVVKRHEVTDRRLAQGSMRQWSKECGSTKLNTETEAGKKNQNRHVENGKSNLE